MTDPGDDCGCCSGVEVDTPAARFNPPGLTAVAYRVGTWRSFRDTLQARLSGTDFPALAPLRTRDPGDWTMALVDAFSCVADVLTFYQERIANEAWLRSALERRSVRELAALIGYQPAPGVAASTGLAFTLESAPGQPAAAAAPVVIPVGTRVQSVPGPGEQAQTFETVAAILARVEWNAMAVQRGAAHVFAAGQTSLHLVGAATGLQAGDALLVIGNECIGAPTPGQRWAVRRLTAVQPDAAIGTTEVGWAAGLEGDWSQPASQGVAVFAFRQHAALFGSQAPARSLLGGPVVLMAPAAADDGDWDNTSLPAQGLADALDLDAVYPKVVAGSWLALVDGNSAGPDNVYLHQVAGTEAIARADYALSGRLSRIRVGEDLAAEAQAHSLGFRATSVLAQTEAFALARQPLRAPVFGSTLVLDRLDRLLQAGQALALTGKRQRIAVPADATGLQLKDASGAVLRTLRPGESFPVMAPPLRSDGPGRWLPLSPADLERAPARFAVSLASSAIGVAPVWRWTVPGPQGRLCSIDAAAGRMQLQSALATDLLVAEANAIGGGASAIELDEAGATTVLTLAEPLACCYDRATLLVNANVAPATHGETVAEIAGSGDASQANQRFALKQAPLTHVASATDPQGEASTLQVRVDDLSWHERPTLYGSGPTDRVYMLRQDDDGTTTVQFGDGSTGARLPSASNNVRMTYRKGLGAVGNVRANQLTTLLNRPLGLKAVTNPVPASGGQDAQTLEGTRRNAPLRVLTLDRAVSVTDYADFSQAFAGIAKASACWIDAGPARGIHLTVAGSDGSAIPDGGATQADLLSALRRFGDPLLPLTVHGYRDARFTLAVDVKLLEDADPGKTLAAVQAALRAAYGFEPRDFGQPVTLDEVYAVIQGVAGVAACDVRALYRSDVGPAGPQPAARLLAARPAVLADGSVTAAELLTLDDGALAIGAMP